MVTLYAVSKGSYSDYSVRNIFSTKPLARAYLAKMKEMSQRGGWDDWNDEIEEYELDLPREKWIMTQVRMTKDYVVKGTAIQPDAHGGEGFQAFDIEGNIVWNVATEDVEKAIKVVSEQIDPIILLDYWGKNEELTNALSGKKAI
jgi:hypothetical protein